jgi:type IV pilus assembly protein PilC
MTLYRYQARNKEGQLYEKSVEAFDRPSLYKVIRDEGGSVVSVKEAKSFSTSFSFKSLFGGIKTQDKINFAKNLGSMINAGLPVTRALAVMEKQAKGEALKSLLAELSSDVSRGSTLSESLGRRPKVFSPLFISMVRAGEESGTVSISLAIVASQMEKSYLLARKVRGALIYPALILLVMVVLAALLLIYMVPTLTATFEGLGVKLPLATRVLIGASDFLIENTLAVLASALLLALSAVSYFKSVSGRRVVDVVSLHIPAIGNMIREVQVARTARTLSSLLSAGVEIVVALEVTEEVLQNHLYKDGLKDAKNAIQQGNPISAIFSAREKLYPPFVGEMVAVGEETGKIAEMLLGVANYYEEQVDQKTKDLSTIIEPVLMIVIGLGVGVFAISMLAPTYSLVDYI